MTDVSDTMTLPHDTAAMVYPTDATETDAPRIGKDLFLQIDVGETAAKVHCQLKEKVGDHQDRKVIFKADKDCTLKFNRSEVFGTTEKKIMKGTPTPIKVIVPPGKIAWTFCEVLPEGAACVLPVEHESPPKIIVP
jgi:hypothetical protein